MIPMAPDLTLAYDFKYVYNGTISTATDTDSTAVDTQAYEGPLHALVIGNGSATDSLSSLAVKFLTSTDNVTFTLLTTNTVSISPVTTALSSLVTAARADNVAARYVKVRLTSTTTGTISAPVTVVLILRKKIAGGSGVQSSVTVP